ncbi:MAG: hypothetical protein ACR2RD_00455 [Woeseiaceae bacterium]
MKARADFVGIRGVAKRRVLFMVALLAAMAGDEVTAIEAPEPTDGAEAAAEPADELAGPTHLPEAVRASVKKVVVLPGQGPVGQATTGSYDKNTDGLYAGMEKGADRSGVGIEVGPVRTRYTIPILTFPLAVLGGISGKTQRDIQEFRDRLTEDLAKAASPPLTNDALASDVWWGLRQLPNLNSRVFARSTPIPEDTDAILYVGLENMTIDVQGKDAVITTTASATLRRLSDGEHLYEEEVQYQDRDTLANWTENENAIWHDYANFARHYIGREISAEVFDRVKLKHELKPLPTKSVKRVKKNDWQGVSKTSTPTLAWELKLLGGDDYGEWAGEISPSDISYDVEIYDMQRLVYSAKQVPQPSHAVAEELPCKALRWSVRPSYAVAGGRKFGEWMRYSSDTYNAKANVGRQASEAPAYIQDFPSLNLKCKKR